MNAVQTSKSISRCEVSLTIPRVKIPLCFTATRKTEQIISELRILFGPRYKPEVHCTWQSLWPRPMQARRTGNPHFALFYQFWIPFHSAFSCLDDVMKGRQIEFLHLRITSLVLAFIACHISNTEYNYFK